MKCVVSREELIKLVGQVQSVVPPKPVLPLLNNVLLEVTGGQLVLSATDTLVSMRAFIGASAAEPGSVTLPARKLFQLIRELTADSVEIECQVPDDVRIHSGSSRFRMAGMAKTGFPEFPDFTAGLHLNLDNATLAEMLARASFAAARLESRQVLNGILLRCEPTKVVFLGADGKRAARLSATLENALDATSSYVIPLKAVNEITSLLSSEGKKSATLSLMPNLIAFEVGSIVLTSKLLSGTYPNIENMIPAKTTDPIAVHREELLTLLRQLSVFSGAEDCAVRFSFMPGELQLSLLKGTNGEGVVSMPVNYRGAELNVAFSPHHVINALCHSDDEVVSLSIKDASAPALVTDSTSAEFMLVPMRIR